MAFLNAGAAPFTAGGPRIPVALLGANLRSACAEFTFASDAAGTYTVPIRLPRGAVPMFGMLVTDTSTGSATVALGITGTTGKYRAAAAFTTTGVPTLFGVTAGLGAALTAEEQLIMTVAAAALPASGRMLVMFFWAENG